MSCHTLFPEKPLESLTRLVTDPLLSGLDLDLLYKSTGLLMPTQARCLGKLDANISLHHLISDGTALTDTAAMNLNLSCCESLHKELQCDLLVQCLGTHSETLFDQLEYETIQWRGHYYWTTEDVSAASLDNLQGNDILWINKVIVAGSGTPFSFETFVPKVLHILAFDGDGFLSVELKPEHFKKAPS